MNKVIIILLSCIFIQIVNAQSDSLQTENSILKMSEMVEKRQVKGVENIYNMEKIETSLFIWNANSVYVDVAPNYPSGFMEEIVLINKDDLREYLNVHFFQQISNRSSDGMNCIKLYILSDMKGIIEEVYFSYEEKLNISITELENIENEIKKKCRLSYKSMVSSPIQANYLNFIYDVCE